MADKDKKKLALRQGLWVPREWLAAEADIPITAIMEWEGGGEIAHCSKIHAALERWRQALEEESFEIVRKARGETPVTPICLGFTDMLQVMEVCPKKVGALNVSVADTFFAFMGRATAMARETIYRNDGRVLVACPRTQKSEWAYDRWRGGRTIDHATHEIWLNDFWQATWVAAEVDAMLGDLKVDDWPEAEMPHDGFWELVKAVGFGFESDFREALEKLYPEVVEAACRDLCAQEDIDEALEKLGTHHWFIDVSCRIPDGLAPVPKALLAVVRRWHRWVERAGNQVGRMLGGDGDPGGDAPFMLAQSRWLFSYENDEDLHKAHPRLSWLPAVCFEAAVKRGIRCWAMFAYPDYTQPEIVLRRADFSAYSLWRGELPDDSMMRAAYLAEMGEMPNFMLRLQSPQLLPTLDSLPWLADVRREFEVIERGVQGGNVGASLRHIRLLLGLPLETKADFICMPVKKLESIEAGRETFSEGDSFLLGLNVVVDELVMIVEPQIKEWNRVIAGGWGRLLSVVVYASEEDMERFVWPSIGVPALVHRHALESVTAAYGFLKDKAPSCVELNVAQYLTWLEDRAETLEAQRLWASEKQGE